MVAEAREKTFEVTLNIFNSGPPSVIKYLLSIYPW